MITEQALIIENNPPATSAVIWLHGLGADGHDFEDVVHYLRASKQPVRFILPHAPVQPVTINGGARMRSWYDIKDINFAHREDRQGLEQSRQRLESIISEQGDKGIAAGKIVVAGFSQGAAVTLYSASRLGCRLAGLIALSGYKPFMDEAIPETDHNKGVDLFMAHGRHDPVVPIDLARRSIKAIGDHYRLQWHEYDMQHQLCPEEVSQIDEFVHSVLGLA